MTTEKIKKFNSWNEEFMKGHLHGYIPLGLLINHMAGYIHSTEQNKSNLTEVKTLMKLLFISGEYNSFWLLMEHLIKNNAIHLINNDTKISYSIKKNQKLLNSGRENIFYELVSFQNVIEAIKNIPALPSDDVRLIIIEKIYTDKINNDLKKYTECYTPESIILKIRSMEESEARNIILDFIINSSNIKTENENEVPKIEQRHQAIKSYFKNRHWPTPVFLKRKDDNITTNRHLWNELAKKYSTLFTHIPTNSTQSDETMKKTFTYKRLFSFDEKTYRKLINSE